MLSSEKVFDMVPVMVDIFDKLDFDNYRKKLTEQSKIEKWDTDKTGMKAFAYILKNSAKVKDEFFQIVAISEDKDIEEVKKQSFGKTINSIKEIFSDKEAIDFFKEAMQ